MKMILAVMVLGLAACGGTETQNWHLQIGQQTAELMLHGDGSGTSADCVTCFMPGPIRWDQAGHDVAIQLGHELDGGMYMEPYITGRISDDRTSFSGVLHSLGQTQVTGTLTN